MNQGKKVPSIGAMLARYMVLGVGTVYVLRALDRYFYSPKGVVDEAMYEKAHASTSAADQLDPDFSLEKAISALEKPKAPPQ